VKRTSTLSLLLAIAATALLSSSRTRPTVPAQEPTEKPNILLIITDQQHAGMLSCAGNPNLSTPALDGLAKGGVRFTNAYVTNPVCGPSRISMFTGRMPGSFGMFHNAAKPTIPLGARAKSLGRLIKAAGYDTFYGGKADMSAALAPLASGFDQHFKSSRETLPKACIRFIERERTAPFFAVASFINPHDICFADQARENLIHDERTPIAELYRRARKLPLDQLPPLPSNYAIPEGEPSAVGANLGTTTVTPSRLMRESYGERDWRMYRWMYCRLTERVDQHIGEILDALERNGLEEETLVVFTSDHGDMDASHHLPSKAHFYEESAGVPFILRMTGTLPAGVVNESSLVSTGLDLLPTLCEFAGVAIPDGLLGRSLRTVAEGGRDTPERAFVVTENHTGRMLRTSEYKYCLFIEGEERESLFDMKSDRGELVNLARNSDYASVLDEHRMLLRGWIEESGDSTALKFAIEPDND